VASIDNLVELAESFEEASSLPEVPVSRRNFLGWFGGTLGTAVTSFTPYEAEAVQRRGTTQRRARHLHRNYRQIRDALQLGYSPIVQEPNLRAVVSFDRNSEEGKIQRCMRWKNITDAVQVRYGAPSNILLGMIAQESYGDPTEPNQLGDGGLGLVHMQPKASADYGLDRITNSKKLRDFEQGRKIIEALKEEKADLKDLIKYDDRWHPIINIDAAARMMCDYFEEGIRRRNGRIQSHDWDVALEIYSGRPHWQYGRHVRRIADRINSPTTMRNLARRFNAQNAKTIVQGAPLTFDRYIQLFAEQNRNYGLDRYRNLPPNRVQ